MKKIQLNVRLDEEFLDKLGEEVKKFNDIHSTNITISGLVKMILKKYLDKEGMNQLPTNKVVGLKEIQPSSNNKTKPLTRQNKLNLSTESTVRGRTNDMQDASLVLLPSVDQCRSDVYTASEQQAYRIFVPVIYNNKPIMPTTPSRARKLIKNKEATPFFKRGIFCIKLNRIPSAENTQEIAIGIDPGSKKEGFTIKSESHTFLNIQADAVTYVKDAVEVRKNMRKSRRFRKTPYRKNRINRNHGKSFLSPSTKARWQWKLRIVQQLSKIFPITDIIVEDIKARSKPGKRKWNCSFSPLEVGKSWFYSEIKKYGKLYLKQGYETKELRDSAGLKKSKEKLSEVFEAHCIDSWVLANWFVGGHIKPDNKRMICISPIRLHRRQLHVLRFASGGIRKSYGGTNSCGFKRGSLVKHTKYGLVYIGGTMNGRVSLHSVTNGKRLCQNARLKDIKFKAYNIWKIN